MLGASGYRQSGDARLPSMRLGSGGRNVYRQGQARTGSVPLRTPTHRLTAQCDTPFLPLRHARIRTVHGRAIVAAQRVNAWHVRCLAIMVRSRQARPVNQWEAQSGNHSHR